MITYILQEHGNKNKIFYLLLKSDNSFHKISVGKLQGFWVCLSDSALEQIKKKQNEVLLTESLRIKWKILLNNISYIKKIKKNKMKLKNIQELKVYTKIKNINFFLQIRKLKNIRKND